VFYLKTYEIKVHKSVWIVFCSIFCVLQHVSLLRGNISELGFHYKMLLIHDVYGVKVNESRTFCLPSVAVHGMSIFLTLEQQEGSNSLK